MRCSQCGTMVSYEGDEEPEDVAASLDDTGEVVITFRLVKRCAECGSELKEAELEARAAFAAEVDAERDEVEIVASQPEERHEPKRRGRTFYGASFEWRIVNEAGEVVGSGEASEEIAASDMDEIG